MINDRKTVREIYFGTSILSTLVQYRIHPPQKNTTDKNTSMFCYNPLHDIAWHCWGGSLSNDFQDRRGMFFWNTGTNEKHGLRKHHFSVEGWCVLVTTLGS